MVRRSVVREAGARQSEGAIPVLPPQL